MLARRTTIVALAALSLAVGTGCREKIKQRPAGDAPAATLLVTRDHGARRIVATQVAPAQSVLDALRSVAEVQTAYGGRFVQGIDGVQGSKLRQHDWFFWLDGLRSEVGAADVRVHAGDHVWWDEQSWVQPTPTLALGAFPRPFVGHGRSVAVIGSDALARAVRRRGARLVARSPWRIEVGADARLRDSAIYAHASDDPLAAGLLVAIRHGQVVASDGEHLHVVAGARAVIVGERVGRGATLWIAGLDAANARAAALALARRPALARRAFALALDGRGRIVAYGGRA